MIKFTEKALDEYKKILDTKNKENEKRYYLRIEREEDGRLSLLITDNYNKDDIVNLYGKVYFIYNKNLEESLKVIIVDFDNSFLIKTNN